MMMEGEVDNVKVVVRSRPLTEQEVKNGFVSAVQVNRSLKSISVVNLANKNEPSKTFTFDEVFDGITDQITIYNSVARPIVENVLKGYNGTIFAYGQTGTGKTYTMSGNDGVAEERGIIPNSFAHIFDHISKCKNDKTFLVRVSYLEIYNEDVRDLLIRGGKSASAVSQALEVKERADIGVYVKDLTNVTVSSADHMFKLMQYGNSNRHTGATSMNERSSRSHALFTVTVECCEALKDADALHGEGPHHHLTQGKLHLVDLAGSERQSKTNADGERLKEASKINLSLSNLGNVISALVDSKSTHIPYRNSKLTRLLQDSLGGNSKTVMIANIGPASYNYDETISTLRYANRAKHIKNVTHINEDPKDALLRKFQEQIEQLRRQLENNGVESGEDDDDDGDGGVNGAEEILMNNNNGGSRRRDLHAVDAAYRERIIEMESDVENRRRVLEREKGMIETERRRLAEDLLKKEEELQASRNEHGRLMAKLATLERTLIFGGENMLEKASKQAELLEQSNRDLELARHSEHQLNERLASGEAERMDIEEKYNSLQDEVVGRTRRLKKVWAQYTQAKADLLDSNAQHQREMEAMLESIRQLQKELALAGAITTAFIPDEYGELIERHVFWNEEVGDWQLRCIAYAGNNMRHNNNGFGDVEQDVRRGVGSRQQRLDGRKDLLSEQRVVPFFTSYAQLLGASTTSTLSTSTTSHTAHNVGGFINGNVARSKFRPRSAMKDRNAARIKSLLD